MLLTSTRDPSKEVRFKEALLSGLASDGGLFIPKSIPKIESTIFDSLEPSNIGLQVLHSWIGDEFSQEELRRVCESALDFSIPLHILSETEGLSVLELFHGPSLSFKDIAARTMAGLMQVILEKSNKELTILVATSGDTGSAVADAYSGFDNINVAVLFPKGGVSPVQERQLTAARPGLLSCRVDGSFDDCQRMVKKAFLDNRFADFNLSSANSINIGRLIPQSIYYHIVFEHLKYQAARIVVPCGNLGNISAGILAAEAMHYSVDFVAAHNSNKSMVDFLGGRELSRKTIATLSNAMDVSVPSNLERLSTLFSKDEIGKRISASWKNDLETLESMRMCYEKYDYIADPHTAVALAVADDLEIGTPRVCLATAHPAKFPKAVKEAIGIDVTHERLEDQKGVEKAFVEIGTGIEEFRQSLEIAWKS